MRWRIAIISFLLLSLNQVSANQLEDKPLDLTRIIEQALARSDIVLSQKAHIEEASFLSRQAHAWRNPEAAIVGGPKWEGKSLGPSVGITLTQPFYWPGKQDLRNKVAGYDEKLAEIQKREIELQIIRETSNLAFAYALAKEKKKLAQERRRRFGLIQSYIKGHAFVAPQRMAQKDIVEVRLKNLNAELAEIAGAVRTRMEQLRLYIQVEEAEPEIVVPRLSGQRVINFDEWLLKAQAHNPQLIAQEATIQKAYKQTELMQKEAWPDFSISAFYNRESISQVEQIVGLGFSMSIPVWNANQAGIKAAQKKKDVEEFRARHEQLKVAAQVRELLAKLETAENVVRAFPAAMFKNLDQKLDAIEVEFKKGRVDFLTFIELEKEIAETYYRSIDAQLALAENAILLLTTAGETDFIAQLSQF